MISPNAALTLLLALWPSVAPYLADADAPPPDTDDEAARVCPDGALDGLEACREQLTLARSQLLLDRAARWGDPVYYRRLEARRDYCVWLRDVYYCLAVASGRSSHWKMTRAEALVQLRRLVCRDAYRIGRAAMPSPPPHVPGVEPWEDD